MTMPTKEGCCKLPWEGKKWLRWLRSCKCFLSGCINNKYPAKNFSGFFSGKTTFTDRGWTRMNADESATDRPSAFICVHLRLTMEKLFLICRYLKTYGQVLSDQITLGSDWQIRTCRICQSFDGSTELAEVWARRSQAGRSREWGSCS